LQLPYQAVSYGRYAFARTSPALNQTGLLAHFGAMPLDLMKKCFNQLSLCRGSQGGQFMLDWILKDVALAILMEYEQHVTIKFLFNEDTDARQAADRLRAQFHENAYALRTI
jgi:hypothetical protein